MFIFFVAFPRAIKLARICLVNCLSIKVLKQKRGERVKTDKTLIPFENVMEMVLYRINRSQSSTTITLKAWPCIIGILGLMQYHI